MTPQSRASVFVGLTLLFLTFADSRGDIRKVSSPMVLSACEEFGFVAPELYDEYNPNRTHLIIRFSVKRKADSVGISDTKPDTKYSDKEKKILSFLLNNGQCKAKDIASSLGFGLSATKTILYRLVAAGRISSVGTVKDERYFLAK